MKILTILGARPQFIKAATVSREIQNHNASDAFQINEVIVHTGQHYDANMSEVFFDEMDIPRPSYKLDLGGLDHGAMTGRMIEQIEAIIKKEHPSLILVFGDTNSTLAGAMAGSKLQIPIAHVEAGLRSYNMGMPEEINRVLTDRVSNYLFCPTEAAVENLNNEGFPFSASNQEEQKIFQVGDVMYDTTLFYADRAKKTFSLHNKGLREKEYALCTVHRAENTDDSKRLTSIFQALQEINKELQVVIPLHPRTKGILNQTCDPNLLENLTVIEPLSYLEMQRLEMGARIILTDSGGMQKESYFHGVPCITLRDETEWVETVKEGANILVGSGKDKILEAVQNINFNITATGLYGNGDASLRILKEIKTLFSA